MVRPPPSSEEERVQRLVDFERIWDLLVFEYNPGPLSHTVPIQGLVFESLDEVSIQLLLQRYE